VRYPHQTEKDKYIMVMALDDLMWEPTEGWRDDAACGGTETALFFPAGEEETLAEAAKSVCAACPVSEDCLQYAIATNQSEGVWGGLTGAERRRLRRRLRERERRAS